MAQTTPPSMTPAPAQTPQRNDRTTFSTRVDAFVTWLTNSIAEFSALATNVYNNAVDAFNSATSAATQAGNALAQATNAAASATAAAATANAAAWNAATAYALNANAISQVDFRTYRRKIPGTTATDPANDTTNWVAVIPAAGGLGGATLTTSTTLTASSAGDMLFNPSAPGMVITLPNATTCSKGAVVFAGANASEFDVKIVDSTGVLLGFCRGLSGMSIGLVDNSTAAGVWAPFGLEKMGMSSRYAHPTIAGTGTLKAQRIAIDATRTAFLFGGTSCYVIVYDSSSNTWGAPATVAATVTGGLFVGVLSAANQLLVAFSDAGGATLKTITVTVSGTSCTPNSPVTLTAPAAAIASFGQFVAVPAQSSFVVAYALTAANGFYVRGVAVSGTVPSGGAEQQMVSATIATVGGLYVSGSVVRTIASASTTIRCRPVAVAGTALTPGSPADATVTITGFKAYQNGNGNIVCLCQNTTLSVAIFKLTGTAEAVSQISAGTLQPGSANLFDMVPISAGKTGVVSWDSSNSAAFNVITDTAGTASAGTEIQYAIGASVQNVAIPFANGTTLRTVLTGTNATAAFSVDCSGASPTLSSAQMNNTATVASDGFASSNAYTERSPRCMVAGLSAYGVPPSDFSKVVSRVTNSGITRFNPPVISLSNTNNNNAFTQGANSQELFAFAGGNINGTTSISIQRLEVAA